MDSVRQDKKQEKTMRYYCVKQHDITDCGAACLATIAKQNGYKIPISKIREIAGTDKQGTNAFGMIKAAEQLWVFPLRGCKGATTKHFSQSSLSPVSLMLS